MAIFSDDIIKDMLRRVIAASQQGGGGFTDAMAIQIEQQVRQDWGGTEPYIAHGVDQRRAVRNEKIHTAYWQGGQKDVRRLAQRFGLSEKQIRRIVGL